MIPSFYFEKKIYEIKKTEIKFLFCCSTVDASALNQYLNELEMAFSIFSPMSYPWAGFISFLFYFARKIDSLFYIYLHNAMHASKQAFAAKMHEGMFLNCYSMERNY